MAKVFIGEKSRILEIVSNEEIKRFAEAKYFDGEMFGYENKMVLIIKKPEKVSEALFSDLEEVTGEKAEEILRKVAEMEESSAAGVGMIFG